MDKNGIIPDIIDVAPKAIAKVTYQSGVEAKVGNELTPTQVKDQPTVTWEADNDGLYTLLLVDPDAPSRENPTYREIAHWLVINIPGNKLSNGQTVIEYIGSGPPEGTGLHRYIFLVFKQQEKITTDLHISNQSGVGRLNVKTRDYITKYKLGNPIAGNYYQAQYDDYVPTIHSQFKSKK